MQQLPVEQEDGDGDYYYSGDDDDWDRENGKVPNYFFGAALTTFLVGITTYFITVLTSSDVSCDGGFSPGEQLAKMMFILSIITCFFSVIIVFLQPWKPVTILYVLFLVGLGIASFFFIFSIEMTESFCWGWVYGQGAN